MAQKKRSSPVYEKAIVRSAALKSIDPKLDLANGLTIAAFDGQITLVKDKTETYNTALSAADDALNQLVAEESKLKDWSERMLTGVASKFGKNSSQYEMAGGTKKSEVKRPKKKPTPTPPN